MYIRNIQDKKLFEKTFVDVYTYHIDSQRELRDTYQVTKRPRNAEDLQMRTFR